MNNHSIELQLQVNIKPELAGKKETGQYMIAVDHQAGVLALAYSEGLEVIFISVCPHYDLDSQN